MSQRFLLLLPIYLPIVLGALARLGGYFPSEWGHGLKQFCLKVTIPLLVFTSMASLDAQELAQALPVTLSLPLWMTLLWAVGMGISQWPAFREHRIETVLIVMLGNIGYIGWAVSEIAFGAEGLVRSIMFTTLLWPTTLGLAALTRHLVMGKEKSPESNQTNILGVALPVLVAFFSGLFLSLLNLSLPDAVMGTLRTFGEMSSPLILFNVGLSLSFRAAWGKLSMLLPLRLIVGFSAAWVALFVMQFFHLDELSRRVILTLSLMPVGANSLMVGDVMDLDGSYLAGAVTLSTVLALATIPLSLLLF
ncbi:MAG: hypothetical protein MI717_14840 [Spirochaetales bacterium]|nr:hypothetical protein [Spirochaetales bacterium]